MPTESLDYDGLGYSINPSSPEASLSPRSGELLSLPFDQFGRMRVAQTVLTMIGSELSTADLGQRPVTVLDVGGFPGILPRFLDSSNFSVTVLDVVPDNGSIPGYRQASGTELPFEAESYDIVTSLDTLEHIPENLRPQFLAELRRVARNAVLLINPVQSLEADLAEETLNEYIKWLLDAQQEQLKEHRDFHLPDAGATQASFSAEGWSVARFPIANINNWLLMMVAKHYLISLRSAQAASFERTLDRFYNLSFTDADRAEPAYRAVTIAVRPQHESLLSRLTEVFTPVDLSEPSNNARLQLTQLLMTMIDLKVANHEDKGLREQLEARDKHVAQLEQRLATLDVQFDRAKADLANTTAVIQARERDYAAASARLRELEEHSRNLELAIAEFEKRQVYLGRLQGELENKSEHILYLERLLKGIESGRLFRLTRLASRLLGR